MFFHCPQHQCADCEQNTTNAGGMIYRCRWCERGYCEDCLDWDKTDLLGENLKEYELLEFPAVTQAFYIKCPSCHDHHLEDPEARDFCSREAANIDKQYQKLQDKQALLAAAAIVPPTPAESMSYATTVDSSGITTPGSVHMGESSASRKRKAAPGSSSLDVVTIDSSSGESTPKRKGISTKLRLSAPKRKNQVGR